MTAAPPALVLVAHGSRDPRAAVTVRALVRAVGAARPDLVVRAAWLDHAGPRPAAVLRALECAGHRRAVVVPLLLTSAYHHRVDIPEALGAARAAGLRIPVRLADALGPVGEAVDPALLDGLCRRLAEAGMATAGDADRRGARSTGDVEGVVLAAAGTRDGVARESVERVARALGAALALPCRVAYASAAAPTVDAALADLRRSGARRLAVASYFLAPGRLHGALAALARAEGAAMVSAPLADAPEIVRLILHRADAAVPGAGDVPGPDGSGADCPAPPADRGE